VLAVFTRKGFGSSRTEISNTAVIVPGVEHDQVEEGTDLECPPDAEVVVLVWSAFKISAVVTIIPCQLGCKESQLRIIYPHKDRGDTYRIGIHSKYACVNVSTFPHVTSY